MDLSRPLRSLVPSLDSVALEVLAGTSSALGPTQIVTVAGRGSRQGIQVVLDRLVEHGLVLSEPTNRGHVYRLNRQHLLAPAVLVAVEARTQLLDRIGEAVRSLDPPPVRASIFGSFARGEAGAESDIDLLLVMPDGYPHDDVWEEQIRHLEDAVVSWTGNQLETVTLDETGLARATRQGEPVVAAVEAEGIELMEPVNA